MIISIKAEVIYKQRLLFYKDRSCNLYKIRN